MSFVEKKRPAADPNVESSDDYCPRTPVARIPSTTVLVCHESNAVVVKLMSDFKKWESEDETAAKKLAESVQPPVIKPKIVAKTALDVLTQHFDCTPEKPAELLDDPYKVAEAVPLILSKHFFPVHGG